MLDKVFDTIVKARPINNIGIEDMHLCSPFTTVKLTDGSIGSAGNYAVQNEEPGYNPNSVKLRYQSFLQYDPLLIDILRRDNSLAGLSLYNSVLSALSQSLLTRGTLLLYGVACRDVDNPFSILDQVILKGDVVSLIGYGGALDLLCCSTKVKRLHVYDFMFDKKIYREMALNHIQTLGGDLEKISLIGTDAKLAALKTSDVCFITGSALCNGTMEYLLASTINCREVIIQGPSISLFPIAFFELPITYILTTRKSAGEFEASSRCDDTIYQFVDRQYIVMNLISQ